MGFFPVDEPGRIAVAPRSFGVVTDMAEHGRYAFVADGPRGIRLVFPRWALLRREDWDKLSLGTRLQYHLIPSTRRVGAFLPYQAEILPEGAEPEADKKIEFIPDGSLSEGVITGFLPGKPVGFVVDAQIHRPASFTRRSCRDRDAWDVLRPGMTVCYFLIRSAHPSAPPNALAAVDVAPFGPEEAAEDRADLNETTTGDLMAAVA
ncbi:MAG: hypothetical protein GX493_06185 [Firmicutes bacterium]|nr:hypothetical protein [Bacillota bacterium]